MQPKTEILSRRPTHDQFVPMPEWGGNVYVRRLSAAERDDYDRQREEAGGLLDNFRSHLVALTAMDENGTLLFSPDDVDAISKLPATEVVRVFDKAMDINWETKAESGVTEKKS